MRIFAEAREQILAKLKTLESVKPENVYGYARDNFAGYPAIYITPTSSASDYADTSMRQMDAVFKIRVLQEIPVGKLEHADTIVETAVDEILSLLSLREGWTPPLQWVAPVPSIWGFEDRANGQVRVGEITVRARFYAES